MIEPVSVPPVRHRAGGLSTLVRYASTDALLGREYTLIIKMLFYKQAQFSIRQSHTRRHRAND